MRLQAITPGNDDVYHNTAIQSSFTSGISLKSIVGLIGLA